MSPARRTSFAARGGASFWALLAALARSPRLVIGLVAALGAAALAAGWLLAERALFAAIPPSVALAHVEIAPDAAFDAAPRVIGRDALGQRAGPASAEAAHLALRRDPERGWLARNLAAERRLGIDRGDGVLRYGRRWLLAAGDVIEIGTSRIVVGRVEPTRIAMTVSRRDGLGRARFAEISHFRGRGAETVVRDFGATGAAARSALWLDAAACGAPTGPLAALRGVIDALDLISRRERLVTRIGGGVDCLDRIAVGAPPGALRVLAIGDEVYLAPGGPAGAAARFRRSGEEALPEDDVLGRLGAEGGGWTRFAEIEHALDGVERLILGRTVYRPEELASGALRLTPIAGAQRFWLLDAGGPRLPLAEARDWRAGCAAAAPLDAADPADRAIDACALAARADAAPEGVSMALTDPVRAPFAGAGLSAWPAALAALLLGALAAAASLARLGRAAWRSGRALRLHRGAHPVAAALIGAAVALAGLPVFAALIGAPFARAIEGPILIALWSVATLALFRVPERSARLLLFWLAMSAVIAFGVLCQAQLSYGAPDDRWLRFDARHQLSVALTLLAVTLAASLDMEGPRALLYAAAFRPGWGAWAVRAAPALALALVFGAWLVVGREEGLGGFQPMEAGKLLAVLYFALAAARFHEERLTASALARRGALVASVALFGLVYALLFAAVPGLTGDFSPILILALVGAAMLIGVGGALRGHRLVQIRARRARAAPPGAPTPRLGAGPFAWLRRGGARPWLETVGALVGGAALLGGVVAYDLARSSVSERLGQAEAAGFSIPEQRIAVHLAPERHPDLGAQTHRSRAAIADAPPLAAALDPARRAAPAAGEGATPAALLALPAVQDDFIGAFFANRFGVLLTAALMAAQILVVWLTLDAALGRYAWSGGDYADDAARQPLCFATLGAGLMLAAHWLIAWSNAFGWGPIMGQPMTWISAGNSHILFMAAPFLLVTLTCMRLTPRRPSDAAAAHGLPPPRFAR